MARGVRPRKYNLLEDLRTKGPPRLEVIKWLDHSSFRRVTGTWTQTKDLIKDVDKTGLYMFSVGWVVYENSDVVVMVAHGDRTSNVDGDITIVKDAIVKRWALKDPSNKEQEDEFTDEEE